MSLPSNAEVAMIRNTAEEIPMEESKGADAILAEPDSSDEESFTKNTRGASSWAIFASALANFSDGYQNNLVRRDYQDHHVEGFLLTYSRHQAPMLSSSIWIPKHIHPQSKPAYQTPFWSELSSASSFSAMHAISGHVRAVYGLHLDSL